MVPIASPLNVPLPMFETTTACDAGLLPPTPAENERVFGLKRIVGPVAETVSVTLMFCGLFVTPLADDVTGTVAV